MTADIFRSAAQEAVDRRFRGISLEHPITALLHSLAVEKAQSRSEQPCFMDFMHPPLPNAQQYLRMKSKVSLLPVDSLKERLKLSSPPQVVVELQRALEIGESSGQLARIIMLDPKLTSAILSLVNSPLYAMPTKVETLERAITIMGNKSVSSLALGIRLLSMFDDNAPEGFPMETFWKHSIASAVFAQNIATICNIRDPERCLVAGLLHDLGQILLFSRYPELAMVSLAMQQERDIPLHEAESMLFDMDHALIGGVLFAEWKMPPGVINAALFHHDPESTLGNEPAEVVYVANQIATALGIGCNRVYTQEPGEEIWSKLGLKEEDVRNMVANVDEQLWAMFHTLFPGQ